MGILDIEAGFDKINDMLKYPPGIALLVKQKSFQELLGELLPKINGFIESYGWKIIEQRNKNIFIIRKGVDEVVICKGHKRDLDQLFSEGPANRVFIIASQGRTLSRPTRTLLKERRIAFYTLNSLISTKGLLNFERDNPVKARIENIIDGVLINVLAYVFIEFLKGV